MAFKMKGTPFAGSITPVYYVDMQDGAMGKANNNRTIIVDQDCSAEQVKEVIAHEEIHIEQMERGDLDYDDDNVYWKGKTYSRKKMQEGAKNLPWEAEAYKRA
tara:strand:+ start:10 stop:318 length:309 start_codon:yes stop_codon:yes gene_type:complete